MTDPDEFADRIRVEELRRMGIAIGEEFGAWNATVPQDGTASGRLPGVHCPCCWPTWTRSSPAVTRGRHTG